MEHGEFSAQSWMVEIFKAKKINCSTIFDLTRWISRSHLHVVPLNPLLVCNQVLMHQSRRNSIGW